ncbi:hypothetical protein BGW36DRAFT_263888, partial [Talaromyces proteolyticus]
QIERRRYLQKRNRRRENLIKKAFQMCILCDTEIFLGIRVKETGQVTTFCSDPAGIWSSSLSCLESYYPVPIHKTLDDFLKTREEDEEDQGDPNSEEA